MIYYKMPETNQEVMECLFPHWRDLPVNVLIPVVTRYDNADDPTVVTMLFLAEDSILSEFQTENNDGENVSITLSTEESKGVEEQYDLTVSIEFFHKANQPRMKAILKGDDHIAQTQFVQALYEIDKFYIFIADVNGKLLKVKQFNWNVNDHDEVLRVFLPETRERLN